MRDRARVLSSEEEDALLASAGSDRNWALLLLMLHVGFSAKTTSRLLVQDVWNHGVVHDQVRGKPLHPRATEAVELAVRLTDTAVLFPSREGGFLSQRQVFNVLRDAARRAGINHVSPGLLRRTAAVRMLRAGATFDEMRQFLEHVSLGTTIEYLSPFLSQAGAAYRETRTTTEAHLVASLEALRQGDTSSAKRNAKYAFLLLSAQEDERQVALLRANEVDWSRWDHLMSADGDGELAEKIGCSSWAVARRRRKLGIRHSRWIDWTEIDPLLGTIQDKEISARFGVSSSMVGKRRRKLEIPAAPPEEQPWWRHAGKETDAWISREFDVSLGVILTYRKRHSIPASTHKNSTIDWEQWDSLLGTVLDKDLAEQIGCASTTIGNRRRKKGIQPAGRIDWERWDPILGTAHDRDIAQRAGCSESAIRERRKRKEIE